MIGFIVVVEGVMLGLIGHRSEKKADYFSIE